MRNYKSGDAIRRLYMLVVCAVMILFNSGMILYVLNRIYNLEFRTQLYLRGHIFVMALYIGVFIFLGQVFGGLLVGLRKVGEVMFSFLFTAVLSDIFFYFIVMLLSYKFPDIRPLILVFILQILLSFIWISFFGKLYSIKFRPYDVLLIYNGDSVEDFKKKLRERRDQFNVSEVISSDIPEACF